MAKSSSGGGVLLAFLERQRANFNNVLGEMSIFATQAIVTPNSVLSEEAFKEQGEFLKEELDSELEYESESEVVELANEDELAFLKLWLPKRLVDSFERRGISSLFPIQVVSYPFEVMFFTSRACSNLIRLGIIL